ncbi:MAG: amidohydrolase [Synergistaceae bacterium]|nr:amidohydrolase [Synergistaceae bacterium]
MSINFLAEAQSLRDKLIETRKEFHRNPEIGDSEFKTAELIEKHLDELGIPHRRVIGTGIVARIDGKLTGRNSAVRSDIDALPVTEATGCDFVSQNAGMMHACGHDVHMTGALGAAMILNAHREELSGSVTFLFQPNEEGTGGAQRMIDAGCLDGVEAVFGCHVDPALKAGHVGIKYGNFYAASATWKLTVIGKSSHGAQRDKGIDSIEVASHIVPEILKISGGVVSVGMFHAGTANNILAGQADLAGIIRTYGLTERSRMCGELAEICNNVSAKFGAKSECEITDSCVGIVNDNDELTSMAERTAREVFGDDKVTVIEKPLFISEDFGSFIIAKTGCFYHIGAGCEYPLHSDKFLPDPDAIVTASAMHSSLVYEYNKTGEIQRN